MFGTLIRACHCLAARVETYVALRSSRKIYVHLQILTCRSPKESRKDNNEDLAGWTLHVKIFNADRTPWVCRASEWDPALAQSNSGVAQGDLTGHVYNNDDGANGVLHCNYRSYKPGKYLSDLVSLQYNGKPLAHGFASHAHSGLHL